MHSSVRLVNGVPSYLHRDQLGSVIRITGTDWADDTRRSYRVFGEIATEALSDLTAAPESIGFIGERYDTDAGLQFLNARYYDPELGLFLQPDWFEVTQARVGTNRYAYSLNDPVNWLDPGGNEPNKAQATSRTGILDTIRQFLSNKNDSDERTVLQSLRYTSGDQGGGGQVGPFGGETGLRYVYTERYGWIDMGHFFQVAGVVETRATPSMVRPGSISALAAEYALWRKGTVEVEDAQGAPSRWSYEDAPSNLAGFRFFHGLPNNSTRMSSDDLVHELDSFLRNAGAMAPEMAPNWQQMQDFSVSHNVFETNRSFRPMHNPAVVSRAPAVQYGPETSLRPRTRPF